MSNNIDEMWPCCRDCPYWEICEKPYNCTATELKIKELNKQKVDLTQY